MPVSWQFVSNETGEPADLNKLDEIIAQAWCEAPNAKRRDHLDQMAFLGTGILMLEGGGEVTKKSFESWAKHALSLRDERGEPRFHPDQIKIFHRFLVEEYTFKAWR